MMFTPSVSSSPTYLPSRNTGRLTGLDSVACTLRRSTSRATSWIPMNTAMPTPNSSEAASPRSLMILTSCPAASCPITSEAPTSRTANSSRL